MTVPIFFQILDHALIRTGAASQGAQHVRQDGRATL